MGYPTPREYRFSDADRENAGRQFYRMPVRLVTADPDELPAGPLAAWWQPAGARGGGGIASVLPALAVHTSMDPGAPRVLKDDRPDPAWTPYFYLSRRRVAALAGVSEDTAGCAVRDLERVGMLQTRRDRPRGRDAGNGGPDRVWLRLAATLYPKGKEPYAEIPKRFIYSGTWAALPTAACRQLYLVIAGADRVRNEAAYGDGMDDRAGGRAVDDEHREAAITRARENAPRLSAATLRRLTGIGADETVVRARRALTQAVFVESPPGNPLPTLADEFAGECPVAAPVSVALVRSGERTDGGEWYAPNPGAWDEWFDPAWLNAGLGRLRACVWPAPPKQARAQERARAARWAALSRRRESKPIGRTVPKLPPIGDRQPGRRAA